MELSALLKYLSYEQPFRPQKIMLLFFYLNKPIPLGKSRANNSHMFALFMLHCFFVQDDRKEYKVIYASQRSEFQNGFVH